MGNILIIFQILPAIINALKAIEEAVPGQGNGEAKLAAVREMVEVVDGGLKPMWPQLLGVISSLVSLFNKTGVFSKGAK